MMSQLSKVDILKHAQRIVPKLEKSKHKGQAGRVGLIGGSIEYTGAPYYASYSALKCGADLSFIFCQESAATAIKSYSPELIVYPTFKGDSKSSQEEEEKKVLESMDRFFENLHVLIVGPGLGRDEKTSACVRKVIQKAREKELPLLIDGDGLHVISKHLELIKGYDWAILTPNVNEYKNLCKSAGLKEDSSLMDLCKSLDNVTVIKKGEFDTISDGKTEWKVQDEGGPRRCGGQGDIMSGLCGTFLGWANTFRKSGEKLDDTNVPLTLLAGYAGSLITRQASKAAFKKHFRSTTTPDMIMEIGEQFEKTFPCGVDVKEM